MRLKVPFSVRIAVSTALLVIASLGLFAYLSFKQHSEMILASVTEELDATVRNCAPLIQAGDTTAGTAEAEKRLLDILDTFDDRNPRIREFRILAPGEEGLVIVVTSGGRMPSRPGRGQPYEADKAIIETITKCFKENETCDTGLYRDDQGRWISAFSPIRESSGRAVAILSADRQAVEYSREMETALGQTVHYVVAALGTAVILGILVSVRMTRPLGRLYQASKAAREGRFEPVAVAGSDEVATLTRDFNETNVTLQKKMAELEALTRELEQRVASRTEQLSKSYEELRERQQVIQREMAAARRVQETIIPKSLHRERISVDVEYVPIMAIGGDVGFVAEQGEGVFEVAVGDVTGHGMGAALVVNRAHTLVSESYMTRAPLDSILHRVDYLLSREIADIGIFMTLLLCRFDLAAMKMEYAGGRHPSGLLYRRSEGSMTEIGCRCGMLGVGEIFCEQTPVGEAAVKEGDFVVLFTDGLVEATSDDGEAFGRERLEATVRSLAQDEVDGRKLASGIMQAAKTFTGGYFQDDVLVVAVQIR